MGVGLTFFITIRLLTISELGKGAFIILSILPPKLHIMALAESTSCSAPSAFSAINISAGFDIGQTVF